MQPDNPTFSPVELDTGNGDQTGLLVFDEGKLTAVLCRLDDSHGSEEGKWFVELTFRHMPLVASRTYDSPQAFAAALATVANRK